MSPFLVSLTFFCLMGAAATALYAVFYGSHKVMQERFEEMTLQVRTAAVVSAGNEPLSPGTGRALLQWALQRIPTPKKTRATEKIGHLLVQAGFRRSNAVRVFMLIRLTATIAVAVLGLIGGAIFLGGSRAPMCGMAGGLAGFYIPA